MNIQPRVTINTKTILLIHRKNNMQEVVQACLTDFEQWNVQVANSIREGLQHAKVYQPDAIILEFSIGDPDRLLFLKQLRSRAEIQDIPIALLMLKTKWFDLEKFHLQADKLSIVVMNPLDPARLSIQVAKKLGWN